MSINYLRNYYPIVLLDIIHKYTNPISCEICNYKSKINYLL